MYVPSGEVASSASLVTYLFRQINRIPAVRFIGLDQLVVFEGSRMDIVILDDFAGSGHSAARLWEDLVSDVAKRNPTCDFIFSCMVAHEEAIEQLKARTGFKIAVVDVIPSNHLPFAHDSKIFPTPEERSAAKSILQKYTPVTHALGYAETQSLVAFFFNTPDNTLPVFWAEGEKWQPLCRYGTDLASFEEEVVSGRGRVGGTSSVRTPIITQFRELDAQEIESDQAIAFLEEFPYPALKILDPVIARLKMEAATLRRVISLIRYLRYLLHEQQPVSTSLLIVPIQVREAIAARCFVTPTLSLTINQETSVSALASFVDGVRGGVALTAAGEALGCISYSPNGDEEPVLDRLAPAARESRVAGALAFVFFGSGRVTLIAEGKRVLAHRNSKWFILHPDPIAYLAAIERASFLSQNVLRNAYRFAMRMSDLGHGAIMMIGDDSAVLSLCDATTGEFKWNSVSLTEENWAVVEPLAKQDGALILTSEGLILDGKRMLRPPAAVEAAVPAGTGARHSSAAKMTLVTDAIAVVVSSDGPLTVFRSGQIILSDVA